LNIAHSTKVVNLESNHEATAIMSECLLASSIGVALLDENYRYLELNEALARIHGVRREVSKRVAWLSCSQ